MTLTLSPNTEAALQTLAARHGQAPEEIVEALIQQAVQKERERQETLSGLRRRVHRRAMGQAGRPGRQPTGAAAMNDALPGDDVVAYAVRLSPAASAQAVAEYDRLAQTAGTEAAEDWREGLLAAWAGLARLPLRCPVASEDTAFQEFSPGPPLRVFLYHRGRRST